MSGNATKLALCAVAAFVFWFAGFRFGWNTRDASAQRAAVAQLKAYKAEADRQVEINRRTENFLRDQLDRANAANAGVHLGSMRCAVSLRDASGELQAAITPAAGANGAAADDDTARRVGRDIAPELSAWAERLTVERERLRALQYFNAQQSEAVK